LIAQAMPFPPTGSHYEAWLSNSESHQPLGALFLDEQGKGSLVYTDSGGNNLIGLYDRVEVSIESGSRTGPKSPGQVAFAFRMPADGLVHVRYLLAASPNTPDEAPVMQGLITDIRMIQQNSTGMNTDYKKGDTAAMKQKAQIVLNLIEGDQSPGYKYLDASGELLEPFDGFGLLANGSNTGYIQAAFSEADYAANTPGATLNMINNGEAVKVCTQNLAAWAPQLRENMLAIISSSSGANLVRPIADAVRLADQLLNGIDLDGNQLVDAVPGECGAVLALENSYYMADMPLLPVSPNPTGTATEIPLTASPTNTRVPATIAPTNNPSGSGAQNTSAPPAATKPGNRQNDKPKPTKKNNP